MTARADILNNLYLHTSAGQTAFQAAGTSDIAEIFGSFVGYASEKWDYLASANLGRDDDLLARDDITAVNCGGLRATFAKLLETEFKKKVSLSEATNNRLLTRPDLNCFDPKVKGNVGYFRSKSFNLACFFITHYYIEYDHKFFDPCLMAVYATNHEPVLAPCSPFNPQMGLPYQVGTGRDVKFLRNINGSVPGFSASVYELIAPHQLSEALSPRDFKALKKDVRFTAAVGFGF